MTRPQFFPASATRLVWVVFCGLAVSGCSESSHRSAQAFDELVAAERAFAAASREHGMHDAFLEYLGPDSIVFRPGPVDGRRAQQEAPPPPGTLDWYPARAEVSTTGAFGYTTGPWEYGVEGSDLTYGHYVSVWKKLSDGAWRVALDIGVVHPRPPEWKEPVDLQYRREEQTRVATGTPGPVGRLLLDRDRELTRVWQEDGAVEAYRRFGAEDLTLYRNGRLPMAGEEAFELLAGGEAEVVESKPIGANVSVAGDLGYTYGSLQVRSDDAVESMSYTRIWRNQAEGPRIVIDVEIPLPSPE